MPSEKQILHEKAVIEKFIKYIEAERRYSPLTVRNYRRDVEAFVAWLEREGERFDPARVTTSDLREWIVLRTKQGLSPASVNREVSSLRAFFRFLRRDGVVGQDVFRNTASMRTPKRLPVFVSGESMPSLLDMLDDMAASGEFGQVRDALVVLLFYKSGIRLAELVSINTGDFSSDGGELKVHGKGDKERIVPMVPSVRRRIEEYRALCNSMGIKVKDGALFVTTNGSRLSRTTIYRIVHRLLGESGLQGRKSPHVLRHTFATNLLDRGADMRDIQELMGHSSLKSTQIYTHNSIKALCEVYASAHPRQGDK